MVDNSCDHDWQFHDRLDRCNPVIIEWKCTKCGAIDEDEEDD